MPHVLAQGAKWEKGGVVQAQVIKIGAPDETREVIDITDLDTVDFMQTIPADLAKNGNATFTVLLDPTQALIRTGKVNEAQKIIAPLSVGTTNTAPANLAWSGAVVVAGKGMTFERNGKEVVLQELEVSVSGEVVFTPESA